MKSPLTHSSNMHTFSAVGTRQEAATIVSDGIIMTTSADRPDLTVESLALLSEDGITEANWIVEKVSTHLFRLTPFILQAGIYNFTVFFGGHIIEEFLIVQIQPHYDSAQWDFWGSAMMGGIAGEELILNARKRDKYSNFMY